MKYAKSENQAPATPALLFSTTLTLPEVEDAGSTALCVASASTASSHSTPVTSSVNCARQPAGECAGALLRSAAVPKVLEAPSERSEPSGKVIGALWPIGRNGRSGG